MAVLKRKGIKLGKPKGRIQASILNDYKDRIREWCKFGVSGKVRVLLRKNKRVFDLHN